MVCNGCSGNREKPASRLRNMALCQMGQCLQEYVLQDIVHGSLTRHPPGDEGEVD